MKVRGRLAASRPAVVVLAQRYRLRRHAKPFNDFGDEAPSGAF
jgi:hypothetical protein